MKIPDTEKNLWVSRVEVFLNFHPAGKSTGTGTARCISMNLAQILRKIS